jgi:plasmid stabilization system protein ParE
MAFKAATGWTGSSFSTRFDSIEARSPRVRERRSPDPQGSEVVHTNRPAVPDLLGREVERGFDLISTDPYAGAPAHDPRVEGLRRLHLQRVHYFLYYRTVSPEIVEVVAF